MTGNPGHEPADYLSDVRRTAVDLAAGYVDGRIVILTGSAASSGRMARFLSDAGARTVTVELEDLPTATRERFTALEHALEHPSEDTAARVHAVDPDGTGLAYAGSFTAVHDLLGRRILGARSSASLAIERKDLQHNLLPVPGRVLPLAFGLPESPEPVVVQGIPDDGVAMASSHTYLVPPHAEDSARAAALAGLRRDCQRARVTTLDTGIPCTFYGFVTEAGTVDFGPVEALVFWDPATWRIHAPGIVRPLRLRTETHGQAQATVHTLAARLHELTGYVGAFGTDGVVTAEDYVVHEINPRVCAGFSLLDQLAPASAPLSAVDLVLREAPSAASEALIGPLTRLAAAYALDSTPAYRLWDDPQGATASHVPGVDADLAANLRRRAAGTSLVHIDDAQTIRKAP